MVSTQYLDLRLEEPGDDPISDQVMDILRDTLQPDGKTSLESAVEQITALLPKGRPSSTEVGSFVETCFEAAEQIPYSHPSMIKLVTIIDRCLKSSQLSKEDEAPSDRVQKLGETLRDWWESTFRPCPKPETPVTLTPIQHALHPKARPNSSTSKLSQPISTSVAF